MDGDNTTQGYVDDGGLRKFLFHLVVHVIFYLKETESTAEHSCLATTLTCHLQNCSPFFKTYQGMNN